MVRETWWKGLAWGVVFAAGVLAGWGLTAGRAGRGAAAAPAKEEKPKASGWLTGTADEKFAQIEKHLRGLDVSMAEIGYRYAELLDAGKARNWDYALYQAEKIGLSLRLAVERRPRRGKSAKPFLDESLAGALRAIRTKDGPTLDAALNGLRAGCIQCHRAENVLHMGRLFATVRPTPPAPTTARAIREYKTKLTPDALKAADRSAGRLVFSKHCAGCHRLFGEGADNGPQLTGSQRSDLDHLLARILDPNAVIGHDYQPVTFVTTRGRSITGLVKHEDERTLTLQTATEKVSVPRKEIEQRSASGISFMPEGLLQTLSDEQVRDLFGYLQGPGQVPLPK